MKNQEVFCAKCGDFLVFVGSDLSIQSAVWGIEQAKRAHTCHNDPRATSVTKAAAAEWAKYLAELPPLTEREYLRIQVHWLWENISQFSAATKWEEDARR